MRVMRVKRDRTAHSHPMLVAAAVRATAEAAGAAVAAVTAEEAEAQEGTSQHRRHAQERAWRSSKCNSSTAAVLSIMVKQHHTTQQQQQRLQAPSSGAQAAAAAVGVWVPLSCYCNMRGCMTFCRSSSGCGSSRSPVVVIVAAIVPHQLLMWTCCSYSLLVDVSCCRASAASVCGV